MYDKNPAFTFNLLEESEVQVRLRVVEEVASDGFTMIKDPE